MSFYIAAVTSTLGQDQIDFSIIGPAGQVVYSQSNVSNLRDSYMATVDGTYYLTFQNRSLLVAKTVEVDVTTTAANPCVIATAAYGSELAGPVQFLRGFRDNEVAHTYLGSQFLHSFNAWYYSWAPSVADVERQNSDLRRAVRVLILPLLGSLAVSSAIFYFLVPINSEVGILLAGLVAAALIGLVYLSPMVVALSRATKRRVSPRSLVLVTLLSVVFTILGTIAHGTIGAVQILAAFLVIEVMLCAAWVSPFLLHVAGRLFTRLHGVPAGFISNSATSTLGGSSVGT